ncbi:hypothetical protein N7540_003907 [Penicillium herquei]|nr:hypothetical protein N7540_003907 [Penicillium herquei]
MAAGDDFFVGAELARVLPAQPNPWYRTPHLRRLNFHLLFVIMSAAGLGFDGSMMNGLQSLSTWNDYFGNPSSALLGLDNAVLNIGPILFGGVVAWSADRFGRRITLQSGCLIVVLAAAIQTGSQNIGMFIAARFIIGIGIEFCIVPAPVLTSELAYPTHRAKLTSLLYTSYFAGSILSSWTTFGTYHMYNSTWSWRIPSLLQAAFPLIQFIALFWVPESPRWLISKGRVEEARALLVRWHANGDETSPLVEYEINEIRSHLRFEAGTGKLGWPQMLKTPADKKRLILVVYISFMSQWCGNGIISYYLPLILKSVGIKSSSMQTLLNAILQIVSWIAAITGGLLVDRLGRRTLWLGSITGMLISFTVWTACSAAYDNTGTSGLATAVLVLIFLFQVCYSVAITPLSVSYPVEILPLHSRQKVMGISYIGNSCANLFNSFASPVAIEAIGWRYYLIYIVLLAQFGVVAYFFFPETRGCGLEQIADLFESDKFLLGKAKLSPARGESVLDDEKEISDVHVEHIGVTDSESPESVNK